MSRRQGLLTALAAALSVAPASLTAQLSTLRVQAARKDTIQVEGGGVATVAFIVTNDGADTVRFEPRLQVPAGWTVVMGTSPFRIAPHSSTAWLTSVAIPSSAAFGVYLFGGGVSQAGGMSGDSVSVHVNERRALEILSIEAPAWTIAGGRYEARFLVRNRGNVPEHVSFTATSGRGTRADAQPSAANLSPGANALVTVRAAIAAGLMRSTDDVIELTATDLRDAGVTATASSRTTLIPRAGSGDGNYTTMPAMLALRSIGGASGVAPVVLAGAGLLKDDKTAVTFSLQAPASQQSPFGFGEHDEYFVNVQSERFSGRLGDHLYGFSPLTMSGALGTGAEFRTLRGPITAGAYVQRGRWIPGIGSEEGGVVSASRDSTAQISAVLVDRQSRLGGNTGVASLSGQLRLAGGALLQLESASSDSTSRLGTAQRARLTGTAHGMTYDAGILRGDRVFAGPARGLLVEDAAVSAPLSHKVSLTSTVGLHINSFTSLLGSTVRGRYGFATVGATYDGRATLEYGWLSRRDDGLATLSGTQHGLRASGALPQLGPLSISGSIERGRVEDNMNLTPHDYTMMSLSVRTHLGANSSVSLYGARNQGQNLTGAGNGTVNAGANVMLQLPGALTLSVSSSAQRATLGVLNSSGAWFSQTDARLDYRFANGSSLGVRERIWQNPLMQGSADARAIYLEYRTPLRLPIGPSHRTGRVAGQVLDAETGTPLAGVAVRLGDQAAVTDRNGRVRFHGLDPALYRVAIDATGSAAGALLVGNPTVDLRDAPTSLVTFTVAVAKSARLRVLVRRFDRAAGTLGAHADSLVSAGAQPNMLVTLEGARDTIYQASDDHGRVDFGAVPYGDWTVTLRPGDLPEHYVLEAERTPLTLAPGEERTVELRIVPARRGVTFIEGETELRVKSPMPIARPR